MEFEKILKDLEKSLNKLQKQDISLNDTLKIYEESMEKIIVAKQILSNAELKFKELSIKEDDA